MTYHNQFHKDFCHICTHYTACVIIGIYAYCKACIDMRMSDPDGRDVFIALMNESGVIDIESQ